MNDIYDTLNKREQIDKNAMAKAFEKKQKEISFIPMIDDKYPSNYKSIYKPPFGLFVKGDDSLIIKDATTSNSKTLVGKVKWNLTNNVNYQGKLVWVNLEPLEVDEVIQARPAGNIFYFTEAKDMELLTFPEGNVGISEIYQKSDKLDYSGQNELRVTAGLTKEVDIAPKTAKKIVKQYTDYAKNENITINDYSITIKK